MAKCKTSTLLDLVPAAISGALFCVASSAIIMANKWIISNLGFTFPMTLSLMGMIFSFVAAAIICYATPWVPCQPVDHKFCLLRAAPIGLFTALTLYFGNLAYEDLSVSFLQMLKASTPIAVMVLMYLAGLETPTLKVVLSVLTIAAGTVISAVGEYRFSWRGTLAMSCSQLTEASKLVLMQLLLRGHKLHALEGLLLFSPWACGCLGVGVLLLEWPTLEERGFALVQSHPWVFLGQAALGFGVNLLTILTVKFTSSISFKLISMAKNAAIVLVSVPLFNNPISHLQALGYSITVVGFGCYNYMKLQASPPGSVKTTPYDPLPLDEAEPSQGAERGAAGRARHCLWLATSTMTPNLAAYVVSGVFQPCFVVEMNYSGVGHQMGLLYLMPYYLGMALVLPFVSPERRWELPASSQWRMLLVITAVDFSSQWSLLAGITRTSSGVYTVIYAAAPLCTALLAYILLQRRLGLLQQAALLLVFGGLLVASVGTLTQSAMAASAWVGLISLLVGTALHALVYVLQEMTLVRATGPPLEPLQLCGWIGVLGVCVVCAHTTVAALYYFLCGWQPAAALATLRAAHPRGLLPVVAACYLGKTLTDCVHGWAYFHLMGQLGATSMSVLKAAVATSSFLCSVLFFCNPYCATAQGGPGFFCHYSAVHCVSHEKVLSLALVLLGVVTYSWAARQGLDAGVQGGEDARREGSASDVWALASWRWVRR
ncbi:hypothetical protein AB1Y20_009209 [Prymnesium parvum]|uniref:Sugar phosphate transporter domain-containing protein n=1 Tax=Prymnesium parvum TaxID=97485 RepID=A0AB34K361_PRYPA